MSRNKNSFKPQFEKTKIDTPIVENVEEVEVPVEDNIVEEILEVVEPVIETKEVNNSKVKFVKDGISLRVRKSPAAGDNVVGCLEPGSQVIVYEEIGSWSCISESKDKYVMTEFLK